MSGGRSAARRRAAGLIAALAAIMPLAGCAGATAPSASSARPAASAARRLPAAAAKVVTTASWPAFLDGPRHDSYAPAQKSITPGNAAGLRLRWHAFAGQEFLASPTVADGAVFMQQFYNGYGGFATRRSDKDGVCITVNLGIGLGAGLQKQRIEGFIADSGFNSLVEGIIKKFLFVFCKSSCYFW